MEAEKKEEPKTYEEAVSLTGYGKFHYSILLCCGTCLVAVAIEILSNSYLLPAAHCDFNMTSSDKGLLTSIVYVGMICTAHMWGFLADTRGRRKMMILSLVSNIVCGIAASVAPSFLLFVIFRFFNGAFICCISSVTFVYLGEFHCDKIRTRAMVLVCTFYSVGNTSLPGLAWAVIPQNWFFELPWCTFNSWRLFVFLCTVPSWISALYLWLLVPESPKYFLAIQKEKEALAVLKHMYAVNTGNDPDLYPVTALTMETSVSSVKSLSPLAIMKHMWKQTKPVFMPPYHLSIIMACSIQFGLYASSNGLILWLPEIYNRISEYQQRFPNETATVCTAVMSTIYSMDHIEDYPTSIQNETISEVCEVNINIETFQNTLIMGASSALAFLGVGYILKYVQKKIILLVCLVTSGCCGFAFYFAQNSAEFIVLPSLYFILSAMCISVVNSVVVDTFPTYLRAMALGLSLMTGRVGTIFTSTLYGELLERNCTALMLSLSSITIGCGILALFIPTVKTIE